MAPENTTEKAAEKTTDWRRLPEAGTLLGMRFLAFTAITFGRTAVSAVLWIVASYYAIVSGRTRRASQQYFARLGRRAGLRDVIRHVHMFARVSVDRLFFLRGKTKPFVSSSNGREHLLELTRRREGAILLGSHLGSFEAMRGIGKIEGLRMSVVVDKVSAVRLARVLQELAPGSDIDVIPMDIDPLSTALGIKRALADGRLVGILGDRRSPEEDRNIAVDFLGAKASFPVGPYLLAHAMKCRVLVVFGIFVPPNRYDLYCEPFADVVQLERGAREESLRLYVQRYADVLAKYTERAPFNWFNFYDFWG